MDFLPIFEKNFSSKDNLIWLFFALRSYLNLCHDHLSLSVVFSVMFTLYHSLWTLRIKDMSSFVFKI